MAQKFITKNIHKKVIRPVRKSAIVSTVETKSVERVDNKSKEETKMENIEKVKKIVGENTVVPKRRVKTEKKDKGLIQRTTESVVVINEDNKMLLND